MIVADASAIAEVLLAREHASSIREALSPHSEIHVPDHFHAEVLSALRRHSARDELDDLAAVEALARLFELRALTYPTRGLIKPIWELRHALTPYDAAYLALACQLDVGLIALDGGLARAASAEGRLVAL